MDAVKLSEIEKSLGVNANQFRKFVEQNNAWVSVVKNVVSKWLDIDTGEIPELKDLREFLNFDELTFLQILVELEVLFGFDVPDQTADAALKSGINVYQLVERIKKDFRPMDGVPLWKLVQLLHWQMFYSVVMPD